jgi:hypothetical protein
VPTTTTTTTTPDDDGQEPVGQDVALALLPTLRSLDGTMTALVERLDAVAETNEEVRRWRRRFTLGLGGLATALVIFAAAMIVWGVLIWTEGVQDNRDELADQRAEAVAQERDRLDGCRDLNEAQRRNRARFERTFDALAARGLNPELVASLRATIGEPEEEDRDCNNNGTLGPGDYEQTAAT